MYVIFETNTCNLFSHKSALFISTLLQHETYNTYTTQL